MISLHTLIENEINSMNFKLIYKKKKKLFHKMIWSFEGRLKILKIKNLN